MMFFHGFHEYGDVIKVHTDDTFHDQILKDLVHHCLKGGGTICETKEHYQEFEEPMACSECSLLLIAFLHANILITPLNIQLCEDLHTAKLIDKVGDEWEGVMETPKVSSSYGAGSKQGCDTVTMTSD